MKELLLAAALLAVPRVALAEDPPADPTMQMDDKRDEAQKIEAPGASSPARPDVDPVSEPPKKEDESDPDKKFTVSGYIEAFYQRNFDNPGNGISNYRGYDDRHNAFTLQNAVIDVGFRAKDLLARIALQVGHAPTAIYQSEPDVHPVKGLLARLELRHDGATSPLFFHGAVEGDGSAERPYVPNARSQTTIMLGLSAWF